MPTEPVFDYTASEPWLISDRMVDTLHEELDRGQSGMEAWFEFENEKVRQLREDPEFRTQLHGVYDQAGINLISPTMICRADLPHQEGELHDLSRWQARFDAIDWLHKVTSPSEARSVVENDEVGIILNSQNFGQAIEGEASKVERFYNFGMRIFQLTYNYQNLLATGCSDPSDGGLATRGQQVVDKLNELNGVIDLSHCGYQTTLDTIEYSDHPVAFTHTACRSVADHFRGKSDEEIQALADADGYMGIVGLPWFIAPGEDDPSLDVFMDHLNHAVSILGSDRVGIGTDFFPGDTKFPAELIQIHEENAIRKGFDPEAVRQRGMGSGLGDFATYTDWPVLKDKIRENYSTAETRNILGENFLSFWERVV
jgi:membrane dipeptidase